MDHPAALHRLQVGVPATVEHSSEAGPETGKWVAETTQVSAIHCAFLSLSFSSFRIYHDAYQLRVTFSFCPVISISARPFSHRHSDLPYPHLIHTQPPCLNTSSTRN